MTISHEIKRQNIDTTKSNSINTSSKTSSKNSTSKTSFDSYTKKTYTYSDIFEAASKKYNVSKDLLEAVAYTESSFRANATSYCGAQGIMQLMPATAKSLGVTDAYDPVQNIMGGAKYLSQLLKKYNGNTSLALAAYNGGSGNVAKYNGVPPFCKSYVNKVEALIKKGVKVPDKSVNVDTLSKSGTLMSDYQSTSSTNNRDSNISTSSNNNNNVINRNFSSNTNTLNTKYSRPKYVQFDQSQLTRIISNENNSNSFDISEEKLLAIKAQMVKNVNNSYNLVDIISSINNYYI